jgi:hypothetical protein
MERFLGDRRDRLRARSGHLHGKARLFGQPLLEGIPNDQFVVHHQNAEFLSPLLGEPDRPGRTNLHAGPAAGAGGHVDGVAVGDVVGHGQIDGLAGFHPCVEFVGDVHRADRRAVAAARAQIRIDPPVPALEGDFEIAGLAGNRFQFGVQQNLDVFVEHPLAEAELGAGVPVHQRQHPAHAAPVGGKLEIQLGQNAADMGPPVGQGHAVSEFRQIDCGSDAADPRADHQRVADSPFHKRLSSPGVECAPDRIETGRGEWHSPFPPSGCMGRGVCDTPLRNARHAANGIRSLRRPDARAGAYAIRPYKCGPG